MRQKFCVSLLFGYPVLSYMVPIILELNKISDKLLYEQNKRIYCQYISCDSSFSPHAQFGTPPCLQICNSNTTISEDIHKQIQNIMPDSTMEYCICKLETVPTEI